MLTPESWRFPVLGEVGLCLIVKKRSEELLLHCLLSKISVTKYYNFYLQVNSTLLFTSHDTIAYLSPESHMKQGVLPEMQILP